MILQTRMQVMKKLGGSVKLGHVEALGRGRILVDALFETRKDQPNHLHGVVLGGGKALEDRALGLVVRVSNFSPKTTTNISRAINARFNTRSAAGRKGVAEPITDRRIDLLVPGIVSEQCWTILSSRQESYIFRTVYRANGTIGKT